MGSSDALAQDELSVLVTGFGPFKEGFPRNPSWEIARQLPDYLPAAPAKSALQTRRADAPVLPAVRIRRFPEPVRVNYETVRSLVPRLWGDEREREPPRPAGDDEERDGDNDVKGGPEQRQGDEGSRRRRWDAPEHIDVMLHIGMAGPRPYYSIERRGHRDGYRMRDVDGKLLGDEERHGREGDSWIWHGLPREIETNLALDDVLGRWRGYSPWDADLRVSEDAGRYLCDFIYYSSLAHLYAAGEHRRAVFLHVPADCSDDAVQRGVNLVIQLIRSICESELSRRGGLSPGERRTRRTSDDVDAQRK